MKTNIFALAAAVAVAGASPAFASNEYADALGVVAEEARVWAADPVVVEAIKAQNVETAGFTQEQIDAADAEWRAEVGAADRPLIDAVLGNDASAFLVEQRDATEGMITEIIVMDARGLNVAVSDVTSDYWQGDEEKHTETFGVGADALHLSEVDLDESSQTYQSQVSFVVTDPETGEAIGAVTVGVDVGFLE